MLVDGIDGRRRGKRWLTLDRTAEPVSRDQILRQERGQGIVSLFS